MPATAIRQTALCLQYSSRSDAWHPRTVCTNNQKSRRRLGSAMAFKAST